VFRVEQHCRHFGLCLSFSPPRQLEKGEHEGAAGTAATEELALSLANVCLFLCTHTRSRAFIFVWQRFGR